MLKIVIGALLTLASASVLGQDLEGTWISNCYTKINSAGEYYLIESIVISGNSFTRTVLSHKDESCTRPFINEVSTGTFQTNEIEGQAFKAIDLESHSIKYVPQTSFFVDYFNTVGFCGFNDWNLSGKEVLGEECFGETITPFHYDIFLLSDEIFYLGDEGGGSGSSPETRPVAINSARALLLR